MRRRGFTTVELLTVIGIILVLLGLLLTGLKHVSGSMKKTATQATMHNLDNILGEFAAATKLRTQPVLRLNSTQSLNWYCFKSTQNANPPYVDLSQPPASTMDLDFWTTLWRQAGNNAPLPLLAPGAVSADAYAAAGTAAGIPRENAARYYSDAVCNTQIAISTFMSIPAAQKAILALPQQSLLGPPVSGPDIKTTNIPTKPRVQRNTTDGSVTPPVPVDAWSNPIVFVPASGMMFVHPTDSTKNYCVRARDHKPFWASAGPDGIIGFVRRPLPGNGNNVQDGRDDNVYSTEVLTIQPDSSGEYPP